MKREPKRKEHQRPAVRRTSIADDWRRFRLRLVSPFFDVLETFEQRAVALLGEVRPGTPSARGIQEVLNGVRAAIAARMAGEPSRVSPQLLRAWKAILDLLAPPESIEGRRLNSRRISLMRYQGDMASCLTMVVMADELRKEILEFFRKGRVPLDVQQVTLEQLTDEVEDQIAQESLGWVENGTPWHPGTRNRLEE